MAWSWSGRASEGKAETAADAAGREVLVRSMPAHLVHSDGSSRIRPETTVPSPGMPAMPGASAASASASPPESSAGAAASPGEADAPAAPAATAADAPPAPAPADPAASDAFEAMEQLAPGCMQVPDGAWSLLLHRTRARQVMPFVGAGLSAPTFPSWLALLSKVYDDDAGGFAELKARCNDDLPVATEIMRESLGPGGFEARVTKLFADTLRDKARGLLARPEIVLARDTIGFLAREKLGLSHDADAVAAGDGRSSTARDVGGVLPTDPTARVAELERRAAVAEMDDDFMFRLLAEADAIPYPGWQGLRGQKALVSGPFPAIVTTNWDNLLEMAWVGLDSKNVSAPSTSPESVRRGHDRLPVRYRRDVPQLFAELKAGLRVPRLFKLHGDVSDRGRDEFVGGHADYRRLMVRDVATAQLLKGLSSQYSFLFYGVSLTDKDVLAVLDDMIETFGGEVGPHFYLTADDVSPEKARYLHRHYAVHTIRVPVRDFGTQLDTLVQLCRLGFSLPRGLRFSGSSYTVEGRTPTTLRASHLSVPHGVVAKCTPARMDGRPSDTYVAMAVSCGATETGQVLSGKLLYDTLGRVCSVVPRFEFERPMWRANKMPRDLMVGVGDISIPFVEDGRVTTVWLVNGQVWDVPADEVHRSMRRATFTATWHFLANAVADATNMEMPAMPSHMEPKRSGAEGGGAPVGAPGLARARSTMPEYLGPLKLVRLFMPLLSTGVGMLQQDEAFHAQLSAVGDFVASIQRSRKILPRLEIVMCCYDSELLADLESGRVRMGASLARAMEGWSKFTVLAKDTEMVSGGKMKYLCRQVRLPLRSGTFGDAIGACGLRSAVLPPGVLGAGDGLLAAGITDGCVLTLGAAPGTGAAAGAGAATAVGGGTGGGAASGSGSGSGRGAGRSSDGGRHADEAAVAATATMATPLM